MSSLTRIATRIALGGALAAMAVVAVPQISEALPTDANGSVSLSATGGVPVTGYDLSTATTLYFQSGSYSFSGGTGNLTGLTGPATVTGGVSSPQFTLDTGSSSPHSITPLTSSPIVFSGSDGTNSYTFSFDQAQFGGRTITGPLVTLTEYLIGTVTSDASGFPNQTSPIQTASATLSWTQSGGAGNSVSLSGTVVDPSKTPTVPEPATWAILATGLLGLGFVRYGRRA